MIKVDPTEFRFEELSVITACSVWLLKHAPETVKTVELIFPITGHSFIPPDRVFGNIEKKLRGHENIINPDQYRKIINEHGIVLEMGKDCDVADFKQAAEEVMKSTNTWHFKIKGCKRFFIRRSSNSKYVQVKGEPVYRNEIGAYQSLTKKNRSLQTFNPQIIEKNKNEVKEEKIQDVRKLLIKHFGNNWEENEALLYYKNVFERRLNQGSPYGTTDTEENLCEELEELSEFVV